MPLLSLIIWTPILGAIAIFFLPGKESSAKKIALVSTAIPLILSIYLLFHFQLNQDYQFVENVIWVKGLGVSYFLGVDGLNLSLVLLVSLLSFLVVMAMHQEEYRLRAFYSCLLLMECGLLGVFLSLDLILFYVFWEVVLIPGYFLIGIWGGPNRQKASIKFLMYTLLGSLVMLIAILAIYFRADMHTFSIPALLTANFSIGFQRVIFIFLLIGLAIKVPLFPFHSWQPDAYVEAPNSITVLLSGLVAKMGVYGFIRVGYSLVPQGSATFSWLVCILAVTTIIYANLCAAAQTDLKRMFAYSSLGHMGLIMLGVGALNKIGIEGSIFHMFNHGIIAGAIFMAISMIQDTLGTIEIRKLRMIVHYIPTGAMLFWLLLLASFGLPGMSSFIAEFYILSGAFQSQVIFGIIAMTGTVIMAGYIFSMLPAISFRGTSSDSGLGHHQPSSDQAGTLQVAAYNKKLIFSLISLSVIIIFLGFYPKLLLSTFHNYAAQFIARIQLP
ncbi:MAG: NADH-quinone oxidoreductase subunit M [bacterium]